MQRIFYLVISMIFVAGVSWAADAPVKDTFDDDVSYSVGHQIGRDMVRQGVKVNPELLLKGIMDATDRVEPLIPFEKMIDTLAALKEKIVARANEKGAAARADGIKYLQENAKKSGVITLESGLQYKIIEKGKGQKPKESDMVEVSYKSSDVYGNALDSSYKDGKSTPVRFEVGKVIPGWTEALQMMHEGARWELYIPYQLAFKDKTPLAGQTVIFNVELHRIIK